MQLKYYVRALFTLALAVLHDQLDPLGSRFQRIEDDAWWEMVVPPAESVTTTRGLQKKRHEELKQQGVTHVVDIELHLITFLGCCVGASHRACIQDVRGRAEVRTVFAACLTDSKEARSSGRRRTDTFGASPLASFRTALPASMSRAVIHISDGLCLARSRTACLPMPLFPPVMRIGFPSRQAMSDSELKVVSELPMIVVLSTVWSAGGEVQLVYNTAKTIKLAVIEESPTSFLTAISGFIPCLIPPR